MSRPLEGIKVLDLTTFVAAPVCARLMADLGAEVLKVEHPNGDGWREFGINYNVRFSHDENPVYDIYNSGKRFISLNLKHPESKKIFWELLEEADVFITNTRMDALKRLGFSYEEVKERCPKLIYGMVQGYGPEGPESTTPAFDTTAFWTRSGFLRDAAVKGDSYCPVLPPSGAGDTVTAFNLLSQLTAALYARTKTGKGDFIQVSLYHTGIFTMGTMEIIAQRPWGIQYPRTRMETGAPGGCYRCADDEWLFIATGQMSVALPKMFKMIGREDLLDDPRFATREGRAKHRDEFYQVFADGYRKKTCAEWVRLAKEYDLPLVRMNHYADVSEDEQAWANNFVEHMECRNGETVVMPSSPIRMESVGSVKTNPAPKIGGETAEFMKKRGYSDEQIAALEAEGAIRTK